MKVYYARICWNSAGWRYPTGTAPDGPRTYFGKYGFALEEWLLDPTASLDGWQYGFLQPVQHGYRKWAGSALSLRLFSIPGGGFDRYREEFEIPYCEVLTPHEATRIVARFRKLGRFDLMITQARQVQGDLGALSNHHAPSENLINIRFSINGIRELLHKRPSIRVDYYHLFPAPHARDEPLVETFPGEIPESTQIYEGACKTVTANMYERDPRARAACLRRWGYSCSVCGIDFKVVYGPIGTEFIHVHHLVPLSRIRKSYRVHATKDLRPVCPNCHAMLHRGPQPPSIEQLKQSMTDAAKYRQSSNR